jgi:hypothetical protein
MKCGESVVGAVDWSVPSPLDTIMESRHINPVPFKSEFWSNHWVGKGVRRRGQ